MIHQNDNESFGETESYDFSFNKRKKELQSLYRDFQDALTKLQEIPEFSFDSNHETPSNKIKMSREEKKNFKINSLIKELHSMKNESLEIKANLLKSTNGKKDSGIESIIDKIDELVHVLSSHIGRAEALMTSLK